MTRRVLHASESTSGGVGEFLSALVADQLARGDSVAVAVPSAGPVPARLAERGARHMPWEAIPQPGPAMVPEARALRSIIRDVDPDVVHLHSSKAGIVGRLLLRRRRATIMQPHAWSFFARTGAVQRATLMWERLGARWADVVLCVSEDERRLAEEAGVKADYRVLPNGVDLERFAAPRPGARERARERLGVGVEPLAVCVGRLHRQKNQAALLDAWPAVRAAVPGARVALVGEGPDRDALAMRAVEGVDLIGQTDDVCGWLEAANVVVQPSRWEGMSLSLLEAMACARSVVVTDVSGMREVVSGDTGGVVPPGDRGALARAVAERLGDPEGADAEGAAGRRRVEQQHDRRVQLAGIAALYDELLERRA